MGLPLRTGEGEPITLQTGQVNTGAFTMDYFRFGQGSETLVILPGLSVQSVMASANAVAFAYRALADAFTVYVLDRRKQLPAVYPVPAMAQDTALALEALGLRNVCLFGASQGGMIALALALAHPERVKKLVLGSTAAKMTGERMKTVQGWADMARQGRAEELYQAFGQAIYPEKTYAVARPVLAALARGVTGEELARFVILAEGTQGFDLLNQVPRLACPVLLLGARDDRVLGVEGTLEMWQLLQNRPSCAMHLYSGYGHASYDLAPDYKQRMVRFLLDQPDSAAE